MKRETNSDRAPESAPSERPLKSPIALRGLDHVVLRIADLQASLHFYTQVLGCSLERRLDELGLVQLRAGAHLIDLVPVDSPLGRAGGEAPDHSAPNLDHFALQLEDFDFAAIRAHLVEHGIEVPDPADRYGAQGTGPSLYLRDPDGNTVELKGPAHTPPGETAGATDPPRSASP